jgi:predicted AlkP superfamily pyrophosphatase or phosphodiesterase
MNPTDVPTFTRFASEGVKADYVQPIFPSLSMTSWTTMITGIPIT